jgi:signal transduction histidine kinase
LAHLVDLACNLLNADAGVIWIVEQDRLISRAAAGACGPAGSGATDEELARRTIATGTTLVYARGPAGEAGEAEERCAYSLAAPVQSGSGGQTAGAFIVHAGSCHASPTPTEWDKKVLAILAHFAALALENQARQQALAEAQEARAVAETFAAMGDVAANLLHHLNNKVGAIPVRVEGIQDKCGPALAANPYLAANLAEIEAAALDAMATVRARLTLLHPIETAPVSVADCVADALAAARLPAGILVTADGLERLPPVMAGRETLALVIVNLLDNAQEAMTGSGRVTIHGRAAEDAVELAISDDGPGIAPDIQARIFDFRFSQRKRSDGGSRATARSRLGFGLWWVKTMMTRLGGSVNVSSDGRSGTTFRLRLPRAQRLKMKD